MRSSRIPSRYILLGSAQAATGIDFSDVIHDLERKVRCKKHYGGHISNVQIATL
jgi:hypothetical protein